MSYRAAHVLKLTELKKPMHETVPRMTQLAGTDGGWALIVSVPGIHSVSRFAVARVQPRQASWTRKKGRNNLHGGWCAIQQKRVGALDGLHGDHGCLVAAEVAKGNGVS